MLKKISYSMVFIILLSSCNLNNRKTYISNLNSFVKNTSENYKNYNQKDWALADSTFMEFQDIGYKKRKPEFTPEESTKVNELLGKYQTLKVKAEILNLKK